MSGYFFDANGGDWREHPRFQDAFVKPLITDLASADLTLTVVKLLPGGEIPHHAHDTSTEAFYVLRGEAYCCVGQQESILKAGQCGHAPPGVSHTVRNVGSDELHAISVFSPPLA